MAGPQNAGFLSDASSFTNSSESEREDYQNIVLAHGARAKVANDQNSSESEGSEGENQDVVFGAELGNVPARARDHKQIINEIWKQTPMINCKKQPGEEEGQKGFITESPFSFKNPIFFSVPRDNASKKVKLLKSKR